MSDQDNHACYAVRVIWSPVVEWDGMEKNKLFFVCGSLHSTTKAEEETVESSYLSVNTEKVFNVTHLHLGG